MNFISFKDPDARVICVSGKYYRKIHKNFVIDFCGFLDSGLYQELVDANLLIQHEHVKDYVSEEFPIVLLPQQISNHVLPFEWSTQMWAECLESFLRCNMIALKYGYILKDSTPYNFTYIGGKMVLFDTSSFIPFKEGGVWNGYRQFCEEMLGPFLLIKYNGINWSKLLIGAIHGLPLSFVSANLPLKSWFNLTSLVHIHLHKQFSNKKDELQAIQQKPTKVFSAKSLQTLLQSLLENVSSNNSQKLGHWKDYYQQYLESDTYLANKKEVILLWIKKLEIQSVTDLGANTGEFSFLASEHVNNVLSIEADPVCVDAIVKQIREKGISNVCPAYVDLTQVSPNLGNNLKEYDNIFERGKSDMVFGLAIIHHLAITYSFTFSQIFELFGQFTSRYLIIEFIPREDDKVKILLQNRGRSFEEYTLENFEKELNLHFKILEKNQISSSERILYLLKKGDE